MNYDFDKIKKLTSSIPNLNKTFSSLKPIYSSRFLISNRFSFVFVFTGGVLFFSTLFNLNLFGVNSDFVYDFRIRPDFISKQRDVTYRKTSKELKFF